MMKFLTIIFLTFYIVKLFTRCKGTKQAMVNFQKTIGYGKSFEASNYNKEELEGIVSVLIKFLFPAIGILLLQIVEFFYIFFAVSHGNTYVTVGFIVFWFSLIAKYFIKDKKKDGSLTEEECNKLLKFRLGEFIINLIDIAYFGYMFFVLFIN